MGFSRVITQVRRRQRQALWLEGVLYGAALAALLLFVTSAFSSDALLLRAAVILAPIAFAAVAVAFGVGVALLKVGDDARTARLVGKRLPELSLDLLSAIELQRAMEKEPHFSPTLANAFLADVESRADRVDLGRVVDTLPWKRALGAAAGVLFLCAGLAFLRGERIQLGLRSVLSSSSAAAAKTQREPVTGDFEVTYNYPAHTGLAPRTVAGTNGEIAAPAGTQVKLRARADRDVTKAELVIGDKPTPMQVENTRDLSGAFVVSASGTFHLVLYTPDSDVAVLGPELPIRVELDEVPTVRLLAPEENIEIDPGEKVTVRYELADDYGLSGLALVYRLPGAKEDARVPLSHDEGRRAKGQHVWDLTASGIRLAPGQRVTYYLEVKDNDAVSGPKKGVSRTQTLKLYSAAEHRREAVKKAEALWERLLLQLADRLEGPDRAVQKDLEKVSAAQSVDAAGLELASNFTTTARDISRERDVPTELLGALVNIGDATKRSTQATQDARRSHLRMVRITGQDPDRGRRLTAAVRAEVTGLERDALYLEALLDRSKMRDLRELARELQRDRRELAALVEKHKQSKDPELQERILRDIASLRARMEELMERMSELAKGIRDEHLNQEALQEMMAERDMSGSLDEVERLMREGKTDEALAKLQELSMQMDNMLAGLDEADDPAGAEQNPELARKFDMFMSELDKTAAEQERLAQETKALRDRARQEAKDRIAQRGKSERDELMKRADALLKDYRSLPPDRLHARADRPLDEASSELENVRNALKSEDYDLAAEAAVRVERAAQDLSGFAEHQRQLDESFQNPPEARAQSKELAQRLAKNAEQARELNQKLQQLFPPAGAKLTEAEKQKVKSLAQSQRALEQRAEGLEQQMDEMSQLAPVFGQEQLEGMRQVGNRMAEAGRRMEGRDVSRGYGEQKAALEALQQFQEQMKQSRSGKGRGGGVPLPSFARREGMGGQDHREKVEIPDENLHRTPKELRQDLLEAMKQGAPDKYRDQVKRYYEELVK